MSELTVWDHYVEGVLGDVIPACSMIKKACQRHLNDLKRSEDPAWPYEFSAKKARRIIEFFCRLQLTKGLPFPGKRFTPEPWQQFILALLFGWVNKETKLRRFMKGYITVPRKNGKSPTFAGIGLYGLMADDEMGAEVYSVATRKDQAKIVWEFAVDFRRHSGDMAEKVEKSVNSLYVLDSGSKFMALASDEDGLDGKNVHYGLVDEYQNHKTDLVYERMVTGISARRQPLLLSTGTAGTDRESPCFKEHEYAVHVLIGDFEDDRYFAFIAEADLNPVTKDYDWQDEETWKKCNPNLGTSKSWDYMRMQAQGARNEPSKLNAFKRLDLNIWTQQEYVYIPMDRWRGTVGEVKRANERGQLVVIDPKNRVAVEDAMLEEWRLPFAGLDLSSKNDITALVNLFPPSERDPHWVLTARFWVPEECIGRRSRNDRVPYQLWVEQGWIKATPGEVVDYDIVEADITELHHKLHYRGVGFDPWNATQINTRLRGAGVQMIEVQQGYKSLTDPTKELLAWILSKKLWHLSDPVMNWMAGNMAVTTDAAGNVKPDKTKARERMDGMAALVDAIHVALLRPVSVYASRGIVTV